MNNTARCRVHLFGALFTLLAGVLLHFAYSWSGGQPVVAVFGAVNESTWEHLKLLFWPALISAIAEFFVYGRQRPAFWWVKAVSILLGLLTIVTLFYTYTGVLGQNFAVVDILLFVIAVAVTFSVSARLMPRETPPYATALSVIGIAVLVLLAVLFAVFTFQPPLIPLFQDAVTGGYGIPT